MDLVLWKQLTLRNGHLAPCGACGQGASPCTCACCLCEPFTCSAHCDHRWLDSTFEGAASLTPADAGLRRTVDALVGSGASSLVSAGADGVREIFCSTATCCRVARSPQPGPESRSPQPGPAPRHRPGLDVVAGTTSYSWGIGSGATPSQLSRFEDSLRPLAAALQESGGPFLAGPELSAADVVIYPFVERFDLALRLFHGYNLAVFDGGSISRWMVSAGILEVWQRAT